MAKSHGWELQTAIILWIFIMLFGESVCKTSQIYYMSGGSDCDTTVLLGGAVVYSHLVNVSKFYGDGIKCELKFKAKKTNWKLMLRVLEMDIPDRKDNGICNDALYVSDSDNVYKPMTEAGGNYGMCGNKLVSTLYSTGRYLTVYFRTDAHKPPSRFGENISRNGRGFKFIITAFTEDFEGTTTCGSSFQCDNHKCIDPSLQCDRVDHCGDYSDEAAEGPAQCGVSKESILGHFLSLGVAASVGIIVGGLIVVILCTSAIVCCCRNMFCKQQRNTSNTTTSVTHSALVSNGGPGSHHGSHHGSSHGSHHTSALLGNGMAQPHTQIDRGGVALQHHPMSPFHNPTHQGYYPMQPVYTSSQHGSTYSGYTQNSAFTRDSGYTHNHYGHTSSVHSSQAPSYHRSHTPTSSKSGKSHHSNTSVTYTPNADKVMLPVNL